MPLERQEQVFGRPIVFNPHMASPGANANLVALGDFRKAYVYAMHTAMTISLQDLPRDPLVYMVLRFRDGGRFVNPRAVRIGRQA
jgi:HK97 family phage major capsid protein